MPKYIISFSNDVIPIDKIDEQQRKKITQIYSNAANDVKKQIDIIEHSSKAGTATSKLQIRRLNDLRDSIEHNIKEANGLIKKEIEANMQKVSEMTAVEYANYLSGQRIVFNISYSRISNDIINNITSGNLYKDQYGADWNFSKRIWGDYTSAKGELSTIVVNGLATGKSTFEIAKDLEKYVTPGAKKPWDWSKVYPGCRKVIDYNAQRLARTMVSHAYQQTLVEMSKHNPYAAGIQWRSALTKRTCELCEQRHGKIFSVKDIPLDHPNGLCTYLMVFDKTTDEITDDLAAWINGEENKNFDEFATYLTGQDFSKISEEQKRKLIKEKEKNNIVNGTNLLNSWQRRTKQFEFDIEDAINAQGFDGMPRIVNEEEFNRLVKEANNGNGFIAQRTYSAPSMEILDSYRQQLYSGKWYVDCSTGGAQYGQGMYCAANYNGILTEGIKNEMSHYQKLNDRRFGVEYTNEQRLSLAFEELKNKGITITDDINKYLTASFTGDFVGYVTYGDKIDNDTKKIIDKIDIPLRGKAPSYTETLTLDSSAKIITFENLQIEFKEWQTIQKNNAEENYDEYSGGEGTNINGLTSREIDKFNIGSYAALKGYDVINSEGHGESGSYTVILNRTKVIFKGE